MEVRLPNFAIVDGQLRIPISKKGGFAFDGSSVVIDLEVSEPEAAAASETANGRSRNKQKDDDPKPAPSNATAATPGKGA